MTAVRPPQQPRIPLYFGGSSDAGDPRRRASTPTCSRSGASRCAETAEQIARVRAAAQAAGRDEPPRISVSFRPILGATDEEAWERAHRILEVARGEPDAAAGDRQALRRRRAAGRPRTSGPSGCWRRPSAASCTTAALWTPIAKADGALRQHAPRSSARPETVAEALLDYVDIGVTTLLIRGFDPYDDAVDYGRDLIPLVREEAARLER